MNVSQYLNTDAECGEEGRPDQLEHGHNVLAVLGRCEVSGHVVDALHERASRLRHLLDLHVVEQAALLLVLGTLGRELAAAGQSAGRVAALELQLALGHLVEDGLEEGARQVLAVVDAAVHVDVVVLGHLLLDRRAVQIGRQHDDAEREHVDRIGTLEEVVAQQALAAIAARRRGWRQRFGRSCF